MPPDRVTQLKNQLEEEIAERKRDAARTKRHARATDGFNKMLIEVTQKGLKLRSAATRIGKAYKLAAGNHTAALAKQEQLKAVETQLLFSVLTILTSGALSWATEFINQKGAAQAASRFEALEALNVPQLGPGWKALVQRMKDALNTQVSARALMTTVLKDTMAAGLGEMFSALGPLWHAPAPSEPASQDPGAYEDDLVEQIDQIEVPAFGWLNKLADKISSMPDDAWDKFDDSTFKAKYLDWQDKATKLADVDDLPRDDLQMADDLERCIWAVWVPRLHFPGRITNAGAEMERYEKVYAPIDDCFVRLGIQNNDETDVSILHREDQDKKLIAWGNDYLKNVQPWINFESGRGEPMLQRRDPNGSEEIARQLRLLSEKTRNGRKKP